MFKPLHPSDETQITVYVDGQPAGARSGEYVAAVLLRTGSGQSRKTPISGQARAPFCMMGVCTDCAATVDGRSSVLTCQTLVHEGMQIERQLEAPSFFGEAEQ